MKTKAIVAMLLIVAAASADARSASPFPRKAVLPDEKRSLDCDQWQSMATGRWSEPERRKNVAK